MLEFKGTALRSGFRTIMMDVSEIILPINPRPLCDFLGLPAHKDGRYPFALYVENGDCYRVATHCRDRHTVITLFCGGALEVARVVLSEGRRETMRLLPEGRLTARVEDIDQHGQPIGPSRPVVMLCFKEWAQTMRAQSIEVFGSVRRGLRLGE
jgi:hypothetical protein